jgi:16S rRNA C967 or C1407 C5-methylase (RsmB/RsmF family)/NOL1/NOP2/fmu family ribosome biogenesis protein
MDSALNLPKDFEQHTRKLLGDEYDSFARSLLTPPPVSIRLNPRKPADIAAAGHVAWCQTGRYLDHRPVFTLDPLFHAGSYYVQEASSMFLEQAVKTILESGKPLRVLDLCAAPGGKSTHLLSLLGSDSLLVSNETIRSRATILSENIQKWGYANVVVTNNDPSAFSELHGFFDLIVIDAPCSGEGLFRKDPDAVAEWSKDAVALCASRQRRIIDDVWPALRQNGVLIYCTCTYNEAENENNLLWLSERHNVDFISIPGKPDGIQEVTRGKAIGHRFYPHRVSGEGFFLSVMRKLGEQAPYQPERRRKSERPVQGVNASWLNGDFVVRERGDLLIAIPGSAASSIDMLSQKLNVVTQGVAMGTMKHGKFIPEHSLSLSTYLNKAEFHSIELDRTQALQYLRKDNLVVETPVKGLALVHFGGNPIGWVNVLDRRINNMYPSAWRIKNM